MIVHYLFKQSLDVQTLEHFPNQFVDYIQWGGINPVLQLELHQRKSHVIGLVARAAMRVNDLASLLVDFGTWFE